MFQYISDHRGQTTGVFIPINDWEEIKHKYKDIEQISDIPEWHKDIVRSRLANFAQNPDSDIDFDTAMDDIEKNL